ncbi:MAG: NAD-dependent epimerase/dehydratase family protein [Nitrospinota bacterium]
MGAPTALVTGATGFVGSHVAEAFLARGYRVRCLFRPRGGSPWLDGLPVEAAYGDCLDPASLERAAAGVEVIIHLAGRVRGWEPEEFHRVNVGGTVNMLGGARRAGSGLRRFVHVSSLAALGPSQDGHPLKEEEPLRPVSAYGRSKAEAEAAVLAASDALPTAIVRPPTVYGPRDRATRLYFACAARGVIPVFRRGGHLSLIYAADLARALVLMAEHPGASGEVFHVADPAPYAEADIVEATRTALGGGVAVPIPPPLLRLAGALSEGVGRLTGRAFHLSRQKAEEILCRDWVCDVSKAIRELGFRVTRTLADGFRETVGWYRQHGWI